MMRTVDFTGSVSSGTMRLRHFGPSFLSVLTEYEHPKAQSLNDEYEVMVSAGGDPEDHEYADDYISDLFDAMDELSPQGYHFGAHEGDGADYGYWQNDEEE